MKPIGGVEILLVAGVLALLLGFLFSQAGRRRRMDAERLERILAEVRGEAGKLRNELRKVEELKGRIEGSVLPHIASLRFKEALKELEQLKGGIPPSLECEIEAYKSEVEMLQALREACTDAVRAWILEAVRLHLPQTAKNWRGASHGYGKQLDELLAYMLAEAFKAEPRLQNLTERFKAENPSMLEALGRLVDPSESLEVFFRMVEKTLGELSYLKVFWRRCEEARLAARLKAALELEKRKIMDRVEGLSEKLLKA